MVADYRDNGPGALAKYEKRKKSKEKKERDHYNGMVVIIKRRGNLSYTFSLTCSMVTRMFALLKL